MSVNVKGSDSLHWASSIDPRGVKAGAKEITGIITGLRKFVSSANVFGAIGIGATVAFGIAGKKAYNFSRDFETAMTEVKTISKAVQDDFDGMSDAVVNMSKEVPDSADKLTKALYQIVSAGYDGAQALEILRVSADLATASMTDTFTAADAITYVMNAYGDAAGSAANISDKLFTIVKLGKVKMEELAPTISMVTGLAAQLGLSFEELSAIYAESVKTLQPHIATTGIRGIMTAMLNISKGTGEAADAAKELGVEFDQAALKSRGFQALLKDIIKQTRGNEAALGRLFPNIRGLVGLLAVMVDEGGRYDETLKQIIESTGATEKATEEMVNTTTNQWKILSNNITAIMKPLGDKINDFVKGSLQNMNDLFEGISRGEKVNRYYRAQRMGDMLDPKSWDLVVPSTGIGGYKESPIDEIIKEMEAEGVAIDNIREKLELLFDEQVNYDVRMKLSEKIMEDYVRQLQEREKSEEEALQTTIKAAESLPTYFKPGVKLPSIKPGAKPRAATPALEPIEQEYIAAERDDDIKLRIVQLERLKEKHKDVADFVVWADEQILISTNKLNDKRFDSFEELHADITKMDNERLRNHIELLDQERTKYDENSQVYKILAEEIDEAWEKYHENERKRLIELSEAINKLGNFILQYDENIGRAIQSTSDLLREINIIATSTSKLSTLSGGVGVGSAFISAMQSLTSRGEDQYSKITKQMEEMNRLTQNQIDLLRTLNGQAVLGKIYDIYQALNNEISSATAHIKNISMWDLQSGQKKGTLGQYYGEDELLNLKLGSEILKSDKELYAKLVSEIKEAQISLIEYQQDYREIITGTTADAIADSITDGLMEGLDSAELFADTFENLMKNAMLSAFQMNIVDQMLKPFYESFAEMTEGGLTKDEINELKSMMLGYEKTGKLGGTYHEPGIADYIKESFGEMSELWDALGFTKKDTQASGMSGAIQGITERTAGLLEGQFNAMRMNMKELLDEVEDINGTNGILRFIHNAAAEVRDNTYYMDDIYEKNKLMLNALQEIRNNSYYNDDIFISCRDIAASMNQLLTINTDIRDYTHNLMAIQRDISIMRSISQNNNQTDYSHIPALRAMG